jgi:hypothetical protein
MQEEQKPVLACLSAAEAQPQIGLSTMPTRAVEPMPLLIGAAA